MNHKRIKHSFPYKNHFQIIDILKVKYPKYFTGKFHPSYYRYLPTTQTQYIRILKSVKSYKILDSLPSPFISKSYEMYYLKNHRSAFKIFWANFSPYCMIENFQQSNIGKLLRTYLFTQNNLHTLSIHLSDYNEDIYNLIYVWMKKLNNLKSLVIQLDFFQNGDEMSNKAVGKVIDAVASNIQSLKLFGCTSNSIELVKHINNCKKLQSLNIELTFQSQRQTINEQLLKLECNQLKYARYSIPNCPASIWTVLLSQLHLCKDLELVLINESAIDRPKIIDTLSTIPKKLRSLSLTFNQLKNNNESKEVHEILSQIIVEEKFEVWNWKPTTKYDIDQMFTNKQSIQELHILASGSYLKEISTSLTQLTQISTLELRLMGCNSIPKWPKLFYDFFKIAPLKTMEFDVKLEFTDMFDFIEGLDIILKKNSLRELSISSSSKKDYVVLVKYLLELSKKNFYIGLFLCLNSQQNELAKAYQKQFQRLRWDLE